MRTILLLFFIAVSVGICLLIEYFHRKACRQKEKEILKFIVSKGGRVTPLEIAAETDQGIKEVKTALDRLCFEGFGKLEITDDGILVYVFEDAMSLKKEHNIIRLGSKAAKKKRIFPDK
ncbi:MAG: hypothetical protein GY749_43725 [Desulfobacteraceae bacterium]|nr:hypothetical protein [Desulfobacteraceae bacterium]